VKKGVVEEIHNTMSYRRCIGFNEEEKEPWGHNTTQEETKNL
jgi:hypothetical protein